MLYVDIFPRHIYPIIEQSGLEPDVSDSYNSVFMSTLWKASHFLSKNVSIHPARKWYIAPWFNVPVEVWTHIWTSKRKINQEHCDLQDTGQHKHPPYIHVEPLPNCLHDLLFENGLNSVIRQHSTQDVLVDVHCEEFFGVPISSHRCYCHFQVQIHVQLKPVTICSAATGKHLTAPDKSDGKIFNAVMSTDRFFFFFFFWGYLVVTVSFCSLFLAH